MSDRNKSFLEEELMQFDDLGIDDILSSEEEKQSKEESNIKSKEEKKLKPLKAGRIVGTVFMGIFTSAILGVICYGGYMNLIKYPKAIHVDSKYTGMACLDNFTSALKSMESIGEGSYISQEVTYANDSNVKVDFYKKMLSTVEYLPYPVEGVNVYGNTLVDRKDNILYTNSTVTVGEPVIMEYIDYSRVPVDRKVISILMEEEELSFEDVDYPNKLVNVFCRYMSEMSEKDIPLKRVKRIPYMVKDGDNYKIAPEEDIYLDRLLFSSREFYDFMDKFSSVASSIGIKNPEWEEWNKLSEEEKLTKEEPERELQEIEPTKEYKEWLSKTTLEKSEIDKPVKYDWKKMLDKTWCGVYYLQNEYTTLDKDGNIIKKPISAEIGNGSIENPAGLNTDVVTSIFVEEADKDGNPVTNEYPINVRMTDFGVSEDAIKWFQEQDVRNRGFDVSSEVQYVYYTFEVTNMSDKELVIPDNSTLADSNANVVSRTGVMYGITDTVTLKPDETAVIESWSRSTELNKRYVIWGSDFKRRVEPVWFRVLAGDIDDPSEDKGVLLNKTRHEEEE